MRFFRKPRGISEKNVEDIRNGYFVLEKRNIFRKSKIENGQKKKTKPKGEEKLKVFHREMKKENEKGDSKETQRSCKKKREMFFFWEKVFSKKKRRVNLRRVDKESEHQDGTYKERKHEKSQNKEEKKREA